MSLFFKIIIRLLLLKDNGISLHVAQVLHTYHYAFKSYTYTLITTNVSLSQIKIGRNNVHDMKYNKMKMMKWDILQQYSTNKIRGASLCKLYRRPVVKFHCHVQTYEINTLKPRVPIKNAFFENTFKVKHALATYSRDGYSSKNYTGELGYDGLSGTRKIGLSYAKSVVYI